MPLPRAAFAAAFAIAVVSGAPALAAPATVHAAPVVKAAVATRAATAPRTPHSLGALTRVGTARKAAATFAAAATTSLPAQVDLRANAPYAGDQGDVGSCVEWAIDYSLMGYWANVEHKGVTAFQPMFLYRQIAAGTMPGAGTYPDQALARSSAATGIDTQADYWQGSFDYADAANAAEKSNATKYRISGYHLLWSGANQGAAAKTAIETSLAAGNPIAITFPVFADFFDYQAGTLYDTTDASTYPYEGGHMTAVYAYDADGIWLRNSWSTDWGSHGDAHMSWDWVEKVVDSAYNVTGITAPASYTEPAPVIFGVSTARGPVAGGTTLMVSGSNLDGVTGVTVGGTAASPATYQTQNGLFELALAVPAHAAGVVDIRVKTKAGTSAVTKSDQFTYVPPLPTVSAMSVSGGTTAGGTTVTLTGTNFVGPVTVSVGGTVVADTETSATSLHFVTPKHAAGAAAVVVTNLGGSTTSNSTTTFTFSAPGRR
jgi:hypothetical protein